MHSSGIFPFCHKEVVCSAITYGSQLKNFSDKKGHYTLHKALFQTEALRSPPIRLLLKYFGEIWPLIATAIEV
jgi:hypothetical protein